MFEIHLGIPEMEELWNHLSDGPVWPKGLGILSGKRYTESRQDLLVLRSE